MAAYGFGPTGARAATARPDVGEDGYASQTWFKDATAKGARDGTVMNAAWLNQIIGEKLYLAEQSGIDPPGNLGDDTWLTRAINGLIGNAIAEAVPDGAGIGALLDAEYGEQWRTIDENFVSEAIAQQLIPYATTANVDGAVATALEDYSTTVEMNAAIQAAIDALVDVAPGALNTLNELAAALGDDANFASTVTTALAGKQPLDSELTSIAALAVTDGNFIVGNGTTFVAENGATARASMGVSIGSDVQGYSARLAEIAALAVTDNNIIVGNGASWVAESGATARTSLGVGTGDTPQFSGMLVGHSAKIASVIGAGNTISPDTQLHGTGGAGSSLGLFRWTNTASGPFLVLSKSRGTTVGDFTAVQANDVIGEIIFAAADGTDFEPAVSVFARISAAPGGGDMPGEFVIAGTNDGAEVVTERAIFKQAGLYLAGVLDLGDTGDTTISRISAGKPGVEGVELLRASGGSTLTGGNSVTPYNRGNMTSFTVDPSLGNYQYGTNNTAITITAPASDCAVEILVTNHATTAGAITFSGFTAPAGGGGDTYATTGNNRYLLMIRRINGVATYAWKALQ